LFADIEPFHPDFIHNWVPRALRKVGKSENFYLVFKSLSMVASFQPARLSTAHTCPKTVIPVSPQGKTGIPRTQARAGKDEIPALRFAWPE